MNLRAPTGSRPIGSQSGQRALLRDARLRAEPDRRVDGAEADIAAPLDDLQEEQVLEAPGVELEVFAALVLVVEDVARLQPLEQLGVEVEARREIVVVVFRD